MTMPKADLWISADWPAPPHVHAGTTTRRGGVSRAPYDSLNLATHVGDEETAVRENRRILRETLALPAEPLWLSQVHGTDVAAVNGTVKSECEADASLSREVGQVCVVMTADCLPLLFCDRAGTVVAAAHAGWRGLLDGVIEATIRQMQIPADELLVWLGPAIGPDAFEVGAELRQGFIEKDAEAAAAFRPSCNSGKWMADLYQLARLRLARCGIEAVYGGGLCSFQDREHFFSYRRDGATGRMASLIWMDSSE